MMKVKMHMLVGVAAVFVLALGANLNNYASAENSAASDNAESGLSVSPSVDKLGFLKPGESYTREITAVNPSNKDVSFKVLTSSFWVEDENYEVKYGVSNSQFGKIVDWTDIDSSEVHVVKAGETYKFKYHITVPVGQAGGAQRLMVTIALGSSVEGGNFVKTETHLNTLVYANIEGDVHPGAEVVTQDIQGFSFEPSVSATSSVRNTGDVDLDVKYRVALTDFFSGSEAYTAEDDKVLMTESTRMFEQKWENAPMLGIFNVTQQITFTDSVHEFKGVTIICPVWIVIVVLIAIAALVIYIVYRCNGAKKRRTRD